ncbi:MAG: c-type cytochrome [Akkermansiaceae bacterium]
MSTQYSNHRDTPLRRFNTFWWGLAYFGLFGAVSAIVVCATKPGQNVEDIRKEKRIEVKAAVDASQQEQLAGKKPDTMGTAVKMEPEASSQFVPGTESHKKALEAASGGGSHPGKKAYLAKNCATCHGPDGKTPTATIYPSLADKDAAYLLKQMQDIKSGARTTALTPAMKPFIGMCSDEEMKAIAEWLAK